MPTFTIKTQIFDLRYSITASNVVQISCLDQLLPPPPRPSPNEGEELVGARDYAYAPSIDNLTAATDRK